MDFLMLAGLMGGGAGAAMQPGGMGQAMMQGAAQPGFGLGQSLVQGQTPGTAMMAQPSQPMQDPGIMAQLQQALAGGGQTNPALQQQLSMASALMQQNQQPQTQQQAAMPMMGQGMGRPQMPGQMSGSGPNYLAQGGGITNRKIVNRSY